MRCGSRIPGVTKSVYGDRRPVEGIVVALLHVTFERRGLSLIGSMSRALKRWEIHELMITDEDVSLGSRVDRVSAVAFFEVKTGGLAVYGDEVELGDHILGHIVGFDLTHMPNHINIVVRTPSLQPPSMKVGDPIMIRKMM